jgi:hypothetical protein
MYSALVLALVLALSPLKYSRVISGWRYCYYFDGTVYIVDTSKRCPQYAP